MIPSEIEPATFRLVAQCLNQLRHRVPIQYIKFKLKCDKAYLRVNLFIWKTTTKYSYVTLFVLYHI
jgi:phosphatidate phosphatase PAH1